MSNVLPKEDDMAQKLAEHEKSLALAENDARVILGPSEEDEGIGIIYKHVLSIYVFRYV